MTIQNIFHVIVDYGKSLLDMIKAGSYDWYNEDINASHFPIQGSGQAGLDIELIKYGRALESDDIVQDLDKRGLRPATLPELLALGAQHPDLQRDDPIVCLGSVWRSGRGIRDVPELSRNGSRRRLDLSYWDGEWHSDYRFAAVRK